MTSPQRIPEIPFAASEYAKLLARLEELTDRLMDAIRRADMDRIASLLDARQSLCAALGDASSSLAQSLEASRGGAAKGFQQIDRESFRLAIGKAQNTRDSLLKKQIECEQLLAGRLDECKQLLTSLRRRQGLRKAYRRPASTAPARFLDSRL